MIRYFWIKPKVIEIIITFVVIKINQYEDRTIYSLLYQCGVSGSWLLLPINY